MADKVLDRESLIRWVERRTPQIRDADGAITGYVIGVEDWRAMRAAIRRFAPAPRAAEEDGA